MKKIIALFAILISLQSFAADTTAVSVQVDGVSKYATLRVTDAVNGGVLSATLSNIQISNPTPALADVATTTNANQIKVTGLAGGTGYATVTCTASYVDPGDGLQKTEQKSIVIAYTVVGTPHGAKLSLTFN